MSCSMSTFLLHCKDARLPKDDEKLEFSGTMEIFFGRAFLSQTGALTGTPR